MGLRQAYEMVIRHQLEMLEDEGTWQFADGQIDKLVNELSNDAAFLDSINEMTSEHLECFGENYDLF